MHCNLRTPDAAPYPLQLRQPVRSYIIVFLLLIRHITLLPCLFDAVTLIYYFVDLGHL